MVRRAAQVALLPLLLATGCSSQSLEERAHEQLQQGLYGRHENALDARARDPESTGQALLESVDPWHYALESSVDDDGVTLLLGIVAEASEMEGWIEPHENRVSVGACVVVVVRTRGGEGGRGIVRTEPAQCPDGTEMLDGIPVDALTLTTTDLEGRMDDVPEPPVDPPKPCYSGGDCSQGGG